jgi:hypothetical protein
MGRLTLIVVCVALLGPTACSASRQQGTVSAVQVSERILGSPERTDRALTERQNKRSESRRGRDSGQRSTNGLGQEEPQPHVEHRGTARALTSAEPQPTSSIGGPDDVTASQADADSPSRRPAPTSGASDRVSLSENAVRTEDRTRHFLLVCSVVILVFLGLFLLTRRVT